MCAKSGMVSFQAFEKAKGDASFPEGNLVRITKEHYPKALEFIRTNFLVQEPIEKALGVPWNEEVEEFWMSFYRWNISIMLLSNDGSKVIAIRTSRFFSSDEVSDDDLIKTPSLKHLMQFVHQGEAKSNYFGRLGTTECMHFFGLGTSDEYRHKHLATRMLNVAVAMARNFGIDPIYIKGEGSNTYSKLVYEHSEFDRLHEEMFEDYVVDGERLIQTADENKPLRFYGAKFSSK